MTELLVVFWFELVSFLATVSFLAAVPVVSLVVVLLVVLLFEEGGHVPHPAAVQFEQLFAQKLQICRH